MLISKKWLAKYIPDIHSIADSEIAAVLTQKLAEVEGVSEIGTGLNKLVAGEVLAVEPHPSADKLRVCQVDIGNKQRPLQIVCGAPNVAVGMRVVVCVTGGTVYNAKTNTTQEIGAVSLRGVDSQGMLCSEKEVGLGENHDGIMSLGEDVAVGTDLDDMLCDSVFEIENKSLTHRGDCFSHRGIAREIAACFNLEFRETRTDFQITQTDTLAFEVEISTKDCKRFAAVSIANIKVGPSPLWLRLALRAVGSRSINNVVDLTNYVMFDVGQPLHAYDFAKVQQNKLIVREARAGEKIAALDSKQYQLEAGDLVISDGKSLHNLAGVIGGENAEVTAETTSVILEAAVFKSEKVLFSARRLGLRTEASVRNGKFVDSEGTVSAIEQAAALVVELTGGDLASEVIDIYPQPVEQRAIDLDLNLVNRIAGANIGQEDMLVYLQRLNILVANRQQLNLGQLSVNMPVVAQFAIPSWRADLKLPQDLAEEVIRLYGYDKLQPRLPERPSTAIRPQPLQALRRRLLDLATNLGYQEVINYSFLAKEWAQLLDIPANELLEIKNAISPELNYSRPSLVPGLLKTLQKNFNTFGEQKLTELGRVVQPQVRDSEKLPAQPFKFALLWGVPDAGQGAGDSERLYLEFKGSVESILGALGVAAASIEYSDLDNTVTGGVQAGLHEFRASTITVTGKKLGYVSEVSPYLTQKIFSQPVRAWVAEIDCELLLNLELQQQQFRPIYPFAPLKRDISFWVPQKLELGKLEKHFRKLVASEQTAAEVELTVELADEYYNNDRRRSATFRVTIQPKQNNITDSQANQLIQKLTTKMSEEFKLQARD